MTRIVRFEEIDGQLVLRVPADVARRLGFAAGDEALLTDGEKGLRIEPVDDQLAVGRAIAARHRDALARLAK